VPVDPPPYREPANLPRHEDDAPRTEYGAPAMQEPPKPVAAAPRPPITPELRFARTALWVGVASIFVFNIVIGPVAVFMGIIARRRGEQRLGRLAIIFGAIGTLVGILLLTLSAAGVIPSVDEMWNDIRNGR
jgi:hypothetical protein